MFSKDDLVVYGSEGVCKIVDITLREFNGADKEYYILVPVGDIKSTVYVPVGNPKLEAKMHRILSSEEIMNLISEMPEQEEMWIDNESVRKATYQEVIKNGRHKELISLIKAVHRHQQELKTKGKKLHQSDARFFAEAQKMLHSEFSVVLNIKQEEVLPFIMNELDMARA